MDYFFNPLFYLVYAPVVASAVLAFLVSYVATLITQAKKASSVEPFLLRFGEIGDSG